MSDSPADRRKFRRADVSHPIRFKLFARDVTLPPTAGYLRDMSLGGARIGLDDPYGHLAGKTLKGLRAKLEITLPGSDTMHLVCTVCWVRRSARSRDAETELGLEFEAMEDWQLQKITAFVTMRHTDRTMFWNVWDSFNAGGR
jgi:c-di-GMP-binding flagellar brake protein YcgR